MLKNYFKIAFRNLAKNLTFSLTNIVGLAIGIGCCLMIGLYIRYELSFESFQKNKADLYRYIPRSPNEGELAMQTYTPAGLAPFFADNFHEIKAYTRIGDVDSNPVFKYNDVTLPPERFIIGDSAFFGMFTFGLVRGDVHQVLSRPLTIVISKSIADRYFPNEDPVGKLIEYNKKMMFEVTGVFQDTPNNSHLQFSYIASFTSLPQIALQLYNWNNPEMLNDFGAWNYDSFFLIPGEVDTDRLQYKLSEKLYARENQNAKMPDDYVIDWLQPLGDIHFTKGIKGDTGGTGDRSYIYIFSAVAIFVLLIACFNFMNLSTALALKRAKEVGLRKTMGAVRYQLMYQFLGETFFLVVIAIIIGFQLVELTLPLFNNVMDLKLSLHLWKDRSFLMLVLLCGFITALIAGSYPAFYLSSFQPSRVLKGEQMKGGKSGIRKFLTVTQFAIATFMIIGTIVVFQQMSFMKSASLGFDKEHIVSFYATTDIHNKYEDFKQRLLQNSGIKAVTICNGVPGNTVGHWRYHFPDKGKDGDISLNTIAADFDYLDVIGVSLAEGRKLSKEFTTDDSLGYLINETAAKELMLEHPVGTPIQVLDGSHGVGKIVGVVKDFHLRSLQHKIEPIVIRFDRGNAWKIAVKLTPGNVKEKLAVIEEEWKRFSPDFPFDYQFVDEAYDKLYRAEEKTGTLMTTFSLLAILVACMGLLGLTSFLTQQRQREIGIRKVLGASAANVVALLSWDFIKLVLTGFVVVIPIAWYVIQQWLQNFAYKVVISPLVFVSSGVLLVLLAFITVGYQSYRASNANPAQVLKDQ
jgi:putative ABC transport system permease protein